MRFNKTAKALAVALPLFAITACSSTNEGETQTEVNRQAEIAAEKANMDNWMEKYKNPLYRIPMTLMEIFPLGLIVSVISALMLKRK